MLNRRCVKKHWIRLLDAEAEASNLYIKYRKEIIKISSDSAATLDGNIGLLQIYDNPRMKSAGGWAYQRQHVIVLNCTMFEDNKDTHPDGYRETLIHELCHILTSRKDKPHGREWQAMMRLFGLEPDRCHNMIVPKNAYRAIIQCPSCSAEYRVSAAKERKLADKRLYRYRCRKCNSRITSDHKVGETSPKQNKLKEEHKFTCRRCGTSNKFGKIIYKRIMGIVDHERAYSCVYCWRRLDPDDYRGKVK
jgi:SprT protein